MLAASTQRVLLLNQHDEIFQKKYPNSPFLRGTKDRRFLSGTGGSQFRQISQNYGRYLVGGSLCACLLWYYRYNVNVVHAKSPSHAIEESNKIHRKLKEDGIIRAKKERDLQLAMEESRLLLQRVKEEYGCPGITVAVSVNGEHVWSDALGLADVENQVPMSPKHVMRIASISKVLTVTALAKLMEKGKVDIDKPVQEYVPSFPENFWENKKVIITTRHILSHVSGIRHYKKGTSKEEQLNKEDNSKIIKNAIPITASKPDTCNKTEETEKGDVQYLEMYSQKKYEEVGEALDQFKDDPLVHKPGTKFLYSTHAWTLVSAVIEAAAKKPFLEVMKETFNDLGLEYTIHDTHKPLIANRARLYHRDKKSKKLENVPYVDLSSKWAGGGFLSTVDDLVKFADAILYSYQSTTASVDKLPGYLKTQTIQKLWTPVDIAHHKREDGCYGLGWRVIHRPQEHGKCRPTKFFVSHSGGAVGASSILLIAADSNQNIYKNGNIPSGVTVAIIVNMDGVPVSKTAEKIAVLFKQKSC